MGLRNKIKNNRFYLLSRLVMTYDGEGLARELSFSYNIVTMTMSGKTNINIFRLNSSIKCLKTVDLLPTSLLKKR